ncbi:proline-rich receptor-like protein kinase PERK1 [Cinnamomum micranthum f. kanehirae]|uniref:non-specific serine/threonine protein kinase n=1 Tax=Cinnamomum micranthum f. kanehirae TaxID=337451 RepID=A0A3S3NDD1_9MAGN|nr:proline-rich receptor-like protein kinase PERK1 [Cinnamomum micranthum f. kanehirae]
MGGCFTKASPKVEDKEISISQNPSAGSPRRLSSDSRLHSSLFSSRKAFIREELERATNGFSESNFLGKGGFGNVHKGILEDGRRVAVKQLIDGSGQGDREFQAEVDIITRVHHRHLVSLVGYCIAEGVRMLVYEYVPNNSLKFHLHGRGEPTLDWPTRLKIALGSAKGLAYLHEDCQPKIIHRDIKSDNILLDLNYEAKIADFGLARIFPDDQTHVEATLAGTIGYLDPEYASSGELTDKSDVYAFGVILLELVTGFQPLFRTIGSTKSNRLVNWAWNRNYQGLLDPRLQMNYNAEELARVVECAAACVRLPAHSRPRMIQVVRVLEGDSSVDSLKKGLTGISRTRSSMDYNPNGHSVTSSITRSSTLNPSRLDRGTDQLTGSIVYHSTMSNQDQGGNGNGIPSSPINNYHM